MGTAEYWVERGASFFASWRFAAVALGVLLGTHALIGLVLAVPLPHESELGQFAEEFRVWCLGYDPVTGTYQKAYVLMLVAEPIVLGGGIALVWYGELVRAWRTLRRQVLLTGAFSLSLVAVAAVSLVRAQRGERTDTLPFPATSLRTSAPAPAFTFVDHESRPLALEDLRGRVVVLTGVYASCTATCPMILGQAKRALSALTEAERASVTVVAITMDPERDTPSMLQEMALAQQVSAPRFRLVTGDPFEIARVLDTLGVSRRLDPETGRIDHTNVLGLVDRRGRLAYRFALGERQEAWLVEALRLLVHEGPPGRAT